MNERKPPLSRTIKARASRRKQRLIRMGARANSANSRQVPVAFQLVSGLIVLIAIGTALFMIPGAGTRKLSLMEALFTSTSAAAVTGLSLFPVSTDLTLWGQLILLLLVQIGGVGLIVAVVLVFRLIGRQVTLGERLAVTSSLGLDRPQEIALIMVRAVGLMFAIEGVGAALLFLHWRISGIVPPEKAAFYAIFHAVTSYCNAGFDLFYGLPEYPNGLPTDPLTLLIMGGLIVLGGLGIPIYMELIYRRRKRPFSLHMRVTISISLVLILLGWFGFLISEYRQTGVLSEHVIWPASPPGFIPVSLRPDGWFPWFAGFQRVELSQYFDVDRTNVHWHRARLHRWRDHNGDVRGFVACRDQLCAWTGSYPFRKTFPAAVFTDARTGCLRDQHKSCDPGYLADPSDKSFQPRPGIIRSRVGLLNDRVVIGYYNRPEHDWATDHYLYHVCRTPRGDHHYDLPAGARYG